LIIRIEVSDAEIDNGVVTSDGGAGSDWIAEYELEVVKID